MNILEIIIPVTSLIIGYIGIKRIDYKYTKRNDFSYQDKYTVRYIKQKNKCPKCKKILSGLIQHHHKNGNRSNNKISNCQVIHKKCHLEITNKNKHKRPINVAALKWLGASTIIFFFYLLYLFGIYQ